MSFHLSSLTSLIDPEILIPALAFIQVVFIDIVMAGDNAVAVGVAAAGLAPDKRRLAILYGLIGAVALRVGFVLITVQLLEITGLLLAGGILLLWVCWKMYQELRAHHDLVHAADGSVIAKGKPKTLFSAVLQILAADISMSLDNVLAVAGAAQSHVWVLAFGLLFSIAAMGLAANLIANLLHKYRWIAYLGLVVVLFVACKMICEGGVEVWTDGHCDTTFKCVPVMAANTRDWWVDAFHQAVDFVHKLLPAKA